jgi:hypothetical protein
MSIPRFAEDLAIIQKLSDLPNSTEGLTAAELKARFDKAGLLLQKFINEQLAPSIVSDKIPFTATNEIKATNIYDAILNVHSQVRDAATGTIVNGSVTADKLSEELMERVYGGRPWVSIDTPDSADNVAAGFPIGQLWLRPRFTVTNVENGTWSGTGCNAEASDHNLTITGTNTVEAGKAVQTLANIGIEGDRVFVLFDTGSVDSNIFGMTVSINGEEAQDALNGGVFETHLAGTSLNVQFDVVWPHTSLANGSAEILNFAVVNATQVLRQMSEAKDMDNWASYLTALQPIVSHTSAAEVFIHASDGQWWPFGFETLAVSRGGTGLNAVESGALLVGTGGEAMRPLAPGADGLVMQMVGGQPAWANVDETVHGLGFLHYATGNYNGNNAEARTINLAVAPKILWIVATNATSKYDYYTVTDANITLLPGAKIEGPAASNTNTTTGIAVVELSENKLKFSVKRKGDTAAFMNKSGVNYKWFALY